MLHALAVEQTRREIWWIHGARNSSEHPFAAEVRELLKTLPGSRSHICYSAPKPTDRPTVDFDKVGASACTCSRKWASRPMRISTSAVQPRL
jgi:ferredoxin-NADP reductase